MKSKLNKIIFGVFIFFSMSANASGFKGYKKQTETSKYTYTEKVERFIETKDDFLILISGHAAFYRFPKDLSYSNQVRDYLNSRIKNKELVIFEVDPTTTEILNISDVKK